MIDVIPLNVSVSLTIVIMYFRMVLLRPRPAVGSSGEGSGSGSGSEPVDERLREFIASEITRRILDATPVIFGSIKEGIVELMEDRLRAFRSDMATSQSGSHTLFFKDFRGSGAPDFHGGKRTPSLPDDGLQTLSPYSLPASSPRGRR